LTHPTLTGVGFFFVSLTKIINFGDEKRSNWGNTINGQINKKSSSPSEYTPDLEVGIMTTKAPKNIKLFGILLCAIALLPLLLGFIVFPRPELPPLVSEAACSQYNIRFDGTSLETIYHAPESILADPLAFLQNDPAYILLEEHRARVSDSFPFDAWLNDIQSLADHPEEDRKRQAAYRLYQLLMANQASFCQEIVTIVMPYLPDGAATNERSTSLRWRGLRLPSAKIARSPSRYLTRYLLPHNGSTSQQGCPRFTTWDCTNYFISTSAVFTHGPHLKNTWRMRWSLTC
jgi:hypothetical protein